MAKSISSIQKPSPVWQTIVPAIGIVALTCLAYLPAMNAGFIWDDDVYVTQNPTLRSGDGLMRIWFDIGAVPQYYPLVHTTFWVEYHLWGLNATGYHVINILLHGLAAVLLWITLRRLKLPQLPAWFAAAIFALHPVHVESVAWITERKNVLSLAFYLGALLTYFKFDQSAIEPNQQKRQWRWYAVSLTLFLCALLGKTVTCSLPAAIVLLIWWKRGRLRLSDIAATAPMFALGFALAMLTAWMEKQIVGAKGSEWDYLPVDRILIAGRAVWFYAGKLLWPSNLMFVYPRWEIDASQAWQWVFPISAFTVIIGLWLLRHRIGRGPLVAALLYGGTLVPALGFFDVYPFRFSLIADHFQYHASIGLIVLAVAAGCASLRRVNAPAALIRGLGGFVLLIMIALTWKQTLIYKNAETLWIDTIKRNPDSFLAHNNLATILMDRGDVSRAMEHYQRALEIKKDLPEAHNAMGVDAARRGDLSKAIEHFRAALEAEPDYAAAHNGLGAALARQGNFDEAITHLHRAVELVPQLTDARVNLGLALARQNQLDAAAEQFAIAISGAPDDPKAHYLLGSVLATQGKDLEAIDHFKRVLQINPSSVEANLAMGLALLRLNNPDEAALHFRDVIRIMPDHPEASEQLEQIRSRQSSGDPRAK